MKKVVEYGPFGVAPSVTSAERDFYQDYEWLQPLAEGGMGTVYLAEDKRNDHARCVIKQMRSDPSHAQEERDEARRLFLREVDILRALDNPGIVPFKDHHVTNDGRYFLVMDYITGNNLETTLQSYGPFNQDDAIKVGIQICEVLEYLHEEHLPHKPSIIYRDLKPSNLMLTPDGQVIFIDFGIARILMPTDTATRVVTAGYSPPEQYFGKPEVRSDLYALGATLAHLVTGQRPRPLITSYPSQQNPAILDTFDALIAKLTAHSPSERPPNARSVRHELYKIYQELHPEFEIPDEVFESTAVSAHEDQFVSQKIMKTGLKAASSARKSLPQKRGPEPEVFTDEDMPSSVSKMFENMSKQRTSSQRISRVEQAPNADDARSKAPNKVATRENLATTKSLKTTMDKHSAQGGGNIWQRFIRWVTGQG